MSTRLLTLGMFTLTAGAALAAQTRPAPPAPGGEKAVAGVVASIALTGCLERWSDVAAASGTPDQKPPAGAEFVLTRVDGQVKAPAGSAPAEPTASDGRYLLLSSPTLNYAAHLHHTVKVAGTITPQPSEGTSPADRIADPSRAETNLPAGPTSEAYRMNVVEVATLTMVSNTCGK